MDIFISYRRKDSGHVLPLVDALLDEGISPWLDQDEIDEFAPITDKIRKGLAESKALLAWYSVDYPKSRPCQMEFAAAFLAAQREGDPRRRVLVVNPEAGPGHIEPIELRDAQYAAAPLDAAGYTALAKRIAAHVGSLRGALAGILPIVPPSQYGLKLTGANRFVGRLPDLWRIHSVLHATESAIISGASAPGLVFVNGLGGVGKSLLAEEYALRFGAAYLGGIFWLRAFMIDSKSHSPRGSDLRPAGMPLATSPRARINGVRRVYEPACQSFPDRIPLLHCIGHRSCADTDQRTCPWHRGMRAVIA
jgi:TIR domain